MLFCLHGNELTKKSARFSVAVWWHVRNLSPSPSPPPVSSSSRTNIQTSTLLVFVVVSSLSTGRKARRPNGKDTGSARPPTSCFYTIFKCFFVIVFTLKKKAAREILSRVRKRIPFLHSRHHWRTRSCLPTSIFFRVIMLYSFALNIHRETDSDFVVMRKCTQTHIYWYKHSHR